MGEGEFWVVKSPMVWLQGRFLATPFTKGLAATHAIAVGGPFMQGHTIIVGPMDNGQILIDGQPACTSFPSTCGIAGVATVSYNGAGKLVDSAQSHLVKHIVHIDAPLGVHLQVMRWANHINVKITMRPRSGGQDGVCGNFNGNADDDTTEQIMHARTECLQASASSITRPHRSLRRTRSALRARRFRPRRCARKSDQRRMGRFWMLAPSMCALEVRSMPRRTAFLRAKP